MDFKRIFSPPFDIEFIMSKQKRLKRELLGVENVWLDKKIAVLGGSTTHNIVAILELFLLSHSIRPAFYQSEYAQYWEDAMFENAELKDFNPDLIYIHTTYRNLDSYDRFEQMWERLRAVYSCPLIQNNFEYPFYRVMGNRENSHGKVFEVTKLNLQFAQYAQANENFYINDINYLSASYGLNAWYSPSDWYMYKYALAVDAIPYLAQSVTNIVKSIYGKNKKAFALDLDDTLWGGIVGDDGAENLQVGQETPIGQAYNEFQRYLKAHKDLGVILNVVSKNEPVNAIAGLERPDMTLKRDDFIIIKANWEPKSQNLADIANTLSIGQDAFVFVDDNPAEREIILRQTSAAVPNIGDNVEEYIRILDKYGFFEVTALTSDDAARNEMYKQNAERSRAEVTFADYDEYLDSLEMVREIKPFAPMYMSRIAQLTNKSNQFNLTTKRYTQSEIETAAADPNTITLYGKLSDKFGDNGVVAVTIGEIDGETCHIRLWLMSCRVLKRNMENFMLKELIKTCKARNITEIRGYYYPTAKNAMVKDFYGKMGFTILCEGEQGKEYSLNI